MDEEFDTSVDTSDVDTSADMDTLDVVDDVPDDIPDDIPEDVPEDEPELAEENDLSDDIPEDVPEDEPEMTEDNDLPEDTPEDVPEDEPELTEEDDLSEDILEDVPEDELELTEENDLSDDIPEDVPEDEPELTDEDDLPEGIPEDVPDDEPEITDEDGLPDDVPEDMPEEQEEIEDVFSDVDGSDSAEPADDAQDESMDDAATSEDAEDATSDVDNGDSTEPIEDTQDVPMDDSAADETTEDTASDVDNDDTDESIKSTQDESVSDAVSEKMTDDGVSSNDTADAMSGLSDYMNKHNYGPNDFDTYSQDPEWRELQRKAFPDYELPPLSKESAFNQLSDYMNEHNYGPDDFETYSQDPKWRELQTAAFPDYELPPVNEAVEGVDFNEKAFDAVPDDRKDAVLDTFQDAPDGIKSTINDLSDELTVGDTRTYIDSDGSLKQECCHYSPSDDIIRMKPNYDNGEYAEVFRHEYGHFADSKLGNLSTSDDFIKAMNDDMARFANDNSLKGKMLDDLASNSAIEDRCVSDILSGSFNNDPEIIDRYKNECADYWKHENDYWSGAKGPSNARERETFANMFSVYSGRERNESISFLEKYYPSTTKQFKSYFKC